MRMGTKTLEDLRGVFKDRASMEEDYAKKLSKLSRHPVGTGETGHLERAILQMKGELDSMAKSHSDLATLLRQQDVQVGEFVAKREGTRKSQQMNIEKSWKSLGAQRAFVLKSKVKYEEDAIFINALHAQASLLQGRDLDKATMKLDKAQQTVIVNERDYRNYVNVLKETTTSWNMSWKTFCDLCQDQEEERLEFVKGRLWDWANALSTVAMAEDESAERTRTALEQCEPRTDIKVFVQQTGTGNSIPDPLPFVDFSQKRSAHRQTYKTARYMRSSTRTPGVKHSPSAVDDIARAFHSGAPQQQQQQQQQRAPQQQQPDPRARPNSRGQRHGQSGPPGGAIAASVAANAIGAARPSSRSAIRSNSNLAALASGPLPPSQETAPTRPKLAEPTSRFSVSPGANLRGSSERVPSLSSAASKPGHLPASAFQQRSSVISPSFPPSNETPSFGTPPSRYEAPATATAPPTAPPTAPSEDEEDDPILKALNVLKNTPSQPPLRTSWSTGPAPGAVPLPGMTAPRSTTDPHGATNRESQQSLGRAAAAAFGASPQASSRPSSPAPVASMMQPPAQGGVARPPSRQGSTTPANRFSTGGNLASPGGPGGGSDAFAGVGARGRSPSPQPFNIPDALRPHSPAPNPHRSSSPQPGPQNGFAYPQQQQQQQQQQQAPYSQQFGASQPQLGPVRAVSPLGFPNSVDSGQEHQRHMSGAAANGYAPPPSQYARAASPGPPQGHYAPPPQHQQQPSHQQQASYLSQAPSQQFQPPPQQYQQQQPFHNSPATSPYQQLQGAPQPQQSFHPSQPSSFQQPSAFQPPAQQQQHQTNVDQTPSTHSGASGASMHSAGAMGTIGGGGYAQGAQPASLGQQAHYQASAQQQQAMHQRTGSAASMRRTEGGPPPPPTGQYTDDGKPIIFYVNALYDYEAAGPEEFSFSLGDVIAVTSTEPDGWWQGNKVGVVGGGHLFPSNFTELLP